MENLRKLYSSISTSNNFFQLIENFYAEEPDARLRNLVSSISVLSPQSFKLILKIYIDDYPGKTVRDAISDASNICVFEIGNDSYHYAGFIHGVHYFQKNLSMELIELDPNLPIRRVF